MSVIAPDEKADFVAILHRHQLAEADFLLQETDTTDVVDEVYPLQGYVTIVRQSTLKESLQFFPKPHTDPEPEIVYREITRGSSWQRS